MSDREKRQREGRDSSKNGRLQRENRERWRGTEGVHRVNVTVVHRDNAVLICCY